MGKITGFLEYDRKVESWQAVDQRLKHFEEFTQPIAPEDVGIQGARCMECGIPFCHSGCPLGNLIPDFNDAVYKNNWQKALHLLHSTNNFPEFTGRLCPAPCESACVLGISEPPVAIELIEKYIVERGFQEGWITPTPPQSRTGKKVAIVGSGPAGLAAAQQLNRAGHWVTVFERDNKIGGLLRYGIPDFKLNKNIIDRRLRILQEEGIEFKTGIHVGENYDIENLNDYDAIALCGGATQRRSLPIAGVAGDGVMQAMDFLKYNNQVVDGIKEWDENYTAKNKDVIVIGGGDTGSDCVGTSNRHGAKSVVNFEIMPMPSQLRTNKHPWPYWPFTLKTTSSHEEGVAREWSIMTKEFLRDDKGNLMALKTVDVQWKKDNNGQPKLMEIEGSEREWKCDLVLLALGFTGPDKTLSEQLDLDVDFKSNIKGNKKFQTNQPHIFVAGDMRRGQSLIVWAISEGREAAYHIDSYLMGKSDLPRKGPGDLPTV